MDTDSAQLTQLLRRWSGGDRSAGGAVMQLVYQRIRQLAARKLGEGAGRSGLDPTELANELIINLLEADVAWNDRIHFFKTVAVAMRNILLDLARRDAAVKHGGGQIRVTLRALEGQSTSSGSAELLNDALSSLRAEYPRKADVIELSYLVGLDLDEIAKVLETSVSTVSRDLRFARAWLKERLSE